MNRIYHPYWEWEEVKFNMWGEVNNRELYLKKTFDFMVDCDLFGQWMNKVVIDWEFSCEHNLTNIEQNRVAWLGQAACAYSIQVPEDIVRQVWGTLPEENQICANSKAEQNIKLWESKCQSVQLELTF